MHIYDCFTFFNELDLLEIRCEGLKDSQVTHILVESNLTFTGIPKPLYFQENKARFEKYNIIPITIYADPLVKDPWQREIHQRNSIASALIGLAENEDIIIVSDVDEIPNIKIIDVFNASANQLMYLVMDNYYYYLNCLTAKQGWSSAYMARYEYLKGKDLNQYRAHVPRYAFIGFAGWHYGWMGGTDRIITKLNAFSHSELNTTENASKEIIEEGMRKGYVFWNKSGNFHFIDITHAAPIYLSENQDKFNHMIRPYIIFRYHQIFYNGREQYWKDVADNKWEPETFDVLDEHLKEGMIFIDIGSWISSIAIYAEKLGAKVYAIEPDPVAYEEGKVNQVENNSYIPYFNIAISDKEGTALLNSRTQNGFGNSETSLLTRETIGATTLVETTTLPLFFRNNNINPEGCFIKMDVEGAEVLIFKQAEDFLREYKPTIYFSIHPAWLTPEQIQYIEDIIFSIYEVWSAKGKVYDRASWREALASNQHSFILTSGK